MSVSASEIAKQIRVGEDSHLELKSLVYKGDRVSAPHRNSMADELAAMANSHGGVVVLGVDDRTRSILGIPSEKLEIVQKWLLGICANLVSPALNCSVDAMEIDTDVGDTASVVVITVEQGTHVYKSPGGYMHRIVSSKQPMSSDVLERLMQQRRQANTLYFDETSIAGASMSDLKESLWEKYTVPPFAATNEEMLLKLGILAQDKTGRTAPSVAGLLLCCERPDEYLSNAYVQGVAYRGESRDANYQLDARDIVGPVDRQVVDACQFVKRNMRVYAIKQPGRVDIPQYSIRAVFEAVVNAVAHRDYSVRGAAIRLHMLSDRIILNSPGTLMNSLDVETIQYRQLSRNTLLTSLLARCRIATELGEYADNRTYLMEKRGEGVPIILSRSEEISGRLPEYRLLDDGELMLTIFATPPPDQGDE